MRDRNPHTEERDSLQNSLTNLQCPVLACLSKDCAGFNTKSLVSQESPHLWTPRTVGHPHPTQVATWGLLRGVASCPDSDNRPLGALCGSGRPVVGESGDLAHWPQTGQGCIFLLPLARVHLPWHQDLRVGLSEQIHAVNSFPDLQTFTTGRRPV